MSFLSDTCPIGSLSTIGWPGAIVLVALVAAAAYVLGVMFRS